jgi:hypothetical protein
MRDVVSSILKIGLINSGMFDTLELNSDVRAVHLVGDNNVGKTSLIELIQFLYFPTLLEMHFSKSQAETLAFYFRREGSYMLFSVRTVQGTQRTLGVYGTGTAETRQVFAFDGLFDLADFLDEQGYVIPPQKVGIRLAQRRFHMYIRAEDHERGLVGEHSQDQANVHLFDLARSNFRLLRRLLQNLLRLERLTARDIRLFLNNLVESTGAKTKIDIARDFERKYADTRAIRERINSLQRLKPLIDQWMNAQELATRAQADEQTARIRLGHATERYLSSMEQHYQELGVRSSVIATALADHNTERDLLADRSATLRKEILELERILSEYAALQQQCSAHIEAEIQAERQQIIFEIVELQRKIEQIGQKSLQQITQRVRQLTNERDSLRRQSESQAITHLLAEANLSETQRALIRFLISERLLSLPIIPNVTDTVTLLMAVAEATNLIDSEGTFRGFGLTIPQSTWYRPSSEEVPIAERLADCEHQLVEAQREQEIAQNSEAARQQVQAHKRRERILEELLTSFRRMQEIEQTIGSTPVIHRRLEELQIQLNQHDEQKRVLAQAITAHQHEQVAIQSELRHLEQTRADMRQVRLEIGEFPPECPEDITHIPDRELPELVRLCRKRYDECSSEVRRSQNALRDPRARLEDRYDRAASDQPFLAWVEEQRRLTNEVERLESQLRESYINLVALVKGELDKLTQAFDIVRSRVAELNNTIRRVSISNIERIELLVQESQLVEAIRQTSQLQIDMFAPISGQLSLEESERQIEEYLVGTLRAHGHELSLDNLFQLQFRVTYAQTNEQRTVSEIHAFESNGTAIGVKIIVYLGLIRLLQGTKRGIVTRIPFFLDEVGSLSSNNVRQIIEYCAEHHFLPIFASPTIRADIPHSYILQRDGDRSRLVNEVILTERERTNETSRVDSMPHP